MKWKTSVENYVVNEDGSYLVTLSDKSQKIYHAIINCEGVYSPLRTHTIKDAPNYLGVVMINGICQNKEKIPVKHSYSIVGDCKSRIFWKPYSPGVFMWQLTTKMPLEQA